MKTVTIEVREGDIAQVSSEALITAVNSKGKWFGGIDGVIQRAAGSHFHDLAHAAHAKLPLADGETVVAYGMGSMNRGKFENVVFVIDDLKQPVSDIIYNGLKAAANAGFTSVTLPAIRMGVMRGAVEKTPEETVEKISKGIKRFFEKNLDGTITRITFVVYGDPETARLMREAFARAA